MIISRSNNFIFFKPIKVAGSSVEAALSKNCSDSDIYTGSGLQEEIFSTFHNSAPKNNWKDGKTLRGEDAYNYLKRHGALNLWNEERKVLKLVEPIYSSHESPFMLLDSGFAVDEYKTISILRVQNLQTNQFVIHNKNKECDLCFKKFMNCLKHF